VCTVIARTQILCKDMLQECIGLGFDEESKRFCKEVKESRTKERQDSRKGFFSRIFGSEVDDFLRKARSAWEIEIFEEIKLRRDSNFQRSVNEIQETDSQEG
jgi:hypothetical protein